MTVPLVFTRLSESRHRFAQHPLPEDLDKYFDQFVEVCAVSAQDAFRHRTQGESKLPDIALLRCTVNSPGCCGARDAPGLAPGGGQA